MPQQSKVVMISSTARDLPDHRDKVMHACQRLGMFHPDMMEHLTAADANALEVSLEMVNKADLYIGVFAFRYGYIPEGETISVTEAEYNRAVERKTPRLIFLMSDDHPVKPSDVETGEGAEKLRLLKERLKKERVVGFFGSADDLLAQVIQALVPYREPDLTKFHYVSEIPEPPDAFIAHPYTLLQTHLLVGRQEELNLLTDWVAKPGSDVYAARILNFVAIGGMGKSAVTWKWFNEIAPQEMKPLAGRMWWSFYESDATFENFVTRALAYVTGRPLAEVEQMPAPDREAQLLSLLDREPFLIVLDGLERLLIAYARMDAAHMDDLGARASLPSDSGLVPISSDRGAPSPKSPGRDACAPKEEHRLRKTADPRAGAFFRKLAAVRTARILISTRLYAADLENRVNGDPLPGCFRRDLHGLADDDALELWRRFGVTGARDTLLPIFNRVENHPLLIQALAAEVARFRPAPGDFGQWRRTHPDFDPFRDIPLVQVKSHVLEFALRGLDDRAREALRIIAAFRMPASYDTLTALLIGEARPCTDERDLDAVLAELEDRGLVGWDKRANRYDLHPIVRGVVWSRLRDDTRRDVYTDLHAHFAAVPKIDPRRITRVEDLTPAIELYNTLIGLGRHNDAFKLFQERLFVSGLYRLSAARQCTELLEMLFCKGPNWSTHLIGGSARGAAFAVLGLAYDWGGWPAQAVSLYPLSNHFHKLNGNTFDLGQNLSNLASALLLTGALRKSEGVARQALDIAHQQQIPIISANTLYWLGLTLSARGISAAALAALRLALAKFRFLNRRAEEGAAFAFLAQHSIWMGDFNTARSHAERAWRLAQGLPYERLYIRAARRQGAAFLGLNELMNANERLSHALTRARKVNFVEEELPALIALAELRRQQGKPNEGRELLDDVWDPAERGPYPLLHADAYNVLTHLERDAGNHDKAIAAATEAYRLAWCDGPPFAYHWGLVAARKHLQELGAPEPEMPPFDESKFEPMPEVEIDPEDEFHAGKSDGDD